MKRAKTELEKAQSWCFKNRIFIYPVPINNTTLRIEIAYKDKDPLLGEKIFNSKGGKKDDEKWWEVINELYIDYYKRKHTQ